MNPTLLPAGNGVLATKSATCSSLSRIPVELSPKSVSFRCPDKTTLDCLLMSNNVTIILMTSSVTCVGYEHVIGLDVPVDDAAPVEVLQRQHALRQVEHGVLLLQEAVHGQQGLEVAADHVLHHQEHVVDRLEAVQQTHHERGLGDGQRVPLGDHVVHHVLLD